MFHRRPSMDNWMQLGRPEIDFGKVLHTASGDVGLHQCSGPSIFAPSVGPSVDSFMAFSATFFLILSSLTTPSSPKSWLAPTIVIVIPTVVLRVCSILDRERQEMGSWEGAPKSHVWLSDPY